MKGDDMPLNDCAIYIPTRGRAEQQTTLKNLPRQLRKITYLVVDENEYSSHEQYINRVKGIIKFPKKWGKNIYYNFGCTSDKKQFLSEQASKRYFFLADDDLTFSCRKDGRLLKATNAEMYSAFKTLYSWMKNDGIAHVGFSCRSGNNRIEADYVEAHRCIMFVGFDLDKIHKENIRMNRLAIRSDFDTTLQLLETGHNNRVLYTFAQGHKGSNSQGGCAIYRTEKMMKQNAYDLAALHPGIIKVSEKKTKHAWTGFDNNIRTDVTIGWKRAYKQGQAKIGRKITDII